MLIIAPLQRVVNGLLKNNFQVFRKGCTLSSVRLAKVGQFNVNFYRYLTFVAVVMVFPTADRTDEPEAAPSPTPDFHQIFDASVTHFSSKILFKAGIENTMLRR